MGPTIVTGVLPDDPLAQQEVFGPVLAVLAFDTEDEAVALANGTDYGLAAAVWTAICRAPIAWCAASGPGWCM